MYGKDGIILVKFAREEGLEFDAFKFVLKGYDLVSDLFKKEISPFLIKDP
jgi:hypothetical protein